MLPASDSEDLINDDGSDVEDGPGALGSVQPEDGSRDAFWDELLSRYEHPHKGSPEAMDARTLESTYTIHDSSTFDFATQLPSVSDISLWQVPVTVSVIFA